MKNLINIFVFSLFFFACEKHKDILQFENLIVDPNISKVKDFEIELPYGNEFYADNNDATLIKIHCYDSLNHALPITKKINGNVFSLYVDNKKVQINTQSNFLFKTNIPNSYKLTLEINGIKRDIIIKAIDTSLPKKKIFHVLFRLVNVNLDNQYFENSIKRINEIYSITNNTNLSFKLAEYDQVGNHLKRKGIIEINDGISVDNYNVNDNYLKNGGDLDNYIRIYLVDKMNPINSGEYYSNTNSIFLNYNFILDPNRAYIVRKSFGGLLSHELGHYFGLAHIYRDDNDCIVQANVNDVEAFNSLKQPEYLSLEGKYISNCGNIKINNNLMAGGGNNLSILSSDQIKVIGTSRNFFGWIGN